MKSSPCGPSALTLGCPVHTHRRWARKPLEQAAQPSHLLQAAVMGQTAPKTKENPLAPRAPAAPGTPKACCAHTPCSSARSQWPPSSVHRADWYVPPVWSLRLCIPQRPHTKGSVDSRCTHLIIFFKKFLYLYYDSVDCKDE